MFKRLLVCAGTVVAQTADHLQGVSSASMGRQMLGAVIHVADRLWAQLAQGHAICHFSLCALWRRHTILPSKQALFSMRAADLYAGHSLDAVHKPVGCQCAETRPHGSNRSHHSDCTVCRCPTSAQYQLRTDTAGLQLVSLSSTARPSALSLRVRGLDSDAHPARSFLT